MIKCSCSYTIADVNDGANGANAKSLSVKFSATSLNLSESNQVSEVLVSSQNLDSADIHKSITANDSTTEYMRGDKVYPFHLGKDTVEITQEDIDNDFKNLVTKKGDKFLDILGDNIGVFYHDEPQVGILGEEQPMNSVYNIVPFTRALGLSGAEAVTNTDNIVQINDSDGDTAIVELRANNNLAFQDLPSDSSSTKRINTAIKAQSNMALCLSFEIDTLGNFDGTSSVYYCTVGGYNRVDIPALRGEPSSTIKYSHIFTTSSNFAKDSNVQIVVYDSGSGLGAIRHYKLEYADLDNGISLPSPWIPFQTNANLLEGTSSEWVESNWSVFTREAEVALYAVNQLKILRPNESVCLSCELENEPPTQPNERYRSCFAHVYKYEPDKSYIESLSLSLDDKGRYVGEYTNKHNFDVSLERFVYRLVYSDTIGPIATKLKSRNLKLEYADLDNNIAIPSPWTRDGEESEGTRELELTHCSRNLLKDVGERTSNSEYISYDSFLGEQLYSLLKPPRALTWSVDLKTNKGGIGSMYSLGNYQILPRVFKNSTTEYQRWELVGQLEYVKEDFPRSDDFLCNYFTYGTGVIPTTKNYMLELGSTPHPYEEYRGETLTIPFNTPTPVTLFSGVNTFFTDDNANVSVTYLKENNWFDYIDFSKPTLGEALNIKKLTATVTSGELISKDIMNVIRNGYGIVANKISYAVSSSSTDEPNSWQDTKPAAEKGKYLWTKTVNILSDGSELPATYTNSYTSLDGVGIDSTEIRYALGEDSTTEPSDSELKLSLDELGSESARIGKYLWTKTKITYTDDTFSESYSVSYISKDGTNGVDGNGISSAVIAYALSSSDTNAPADDSSDWKSSMSQLTGNKVGNYLWTRTKLTFSDPSLDTTSYSVSRFPKDGTNGNDGNGIESTEVKYATSQSNVTKPGSEDWESAIPNTNPGDYLWTRTTLKYTNKESSSPSYTVSRIPKDGTNGTNGDGVNNTVVEYAVSKVKGTMPSSWDDKVPVTEQGDYLWTKTTLEFTNRDLNTSSYTVSYISKDGTDGNGIEDAEIAYAFSSSGTSAPAVNSSEWKSTIDDLTGKVSQYLWTRTTLTFTDDDTPQKVSYSASYISKDGNGISDTTIEYALSESGAKVPTTGWELDVDDLDDDKVGRYLWTKTTVTFTDEEVASKVTHSVTRIPKDGDNTVTVFVYTQTDNPSKPSGLTFNPSTKSLSSSETWSPQMPSGSKIWVSSVTISYSKSDTKAITIPKDDWSDPQIFKEKGEAGAASYALTTTGPYPDGFSDANIKAWQVVDDVEPWSFDAVDGLVLRVGDSVTISVKNSDTDKTSFILYTVTEVVNNTRFIGKSKGGYGTGPSGYTQAQISLMKRFTGTPTAFSGGTATYNVKNNSISFSGGNNNGWSITPPSGTGDVYVIYASVVTKEETDIIEWNEWTDPIVLATTGTPGYNSHTIFAYSVSASKPDKPSGSISYDFSDNTLTGLPSGWQYPLTTSGDKVWFSNATVISRSEVETVDNNLWSDPQIFKEKGETGTAGTNGQDGENTVTVFAYTSTNNPDRPSGMTFVIDTRSLNGSGIWSPQMPSGNKIWVSSTTVSYSQSATGSISILTEKWSAPQVFRENGSNGADAKTFELRATPVTYRVNPRGQDAQEIKLTLVSVGYGGTVNISSDYGTVSALKDVLSIPQDFNEPQIEVTASISGTSTLATCIIKAVHEEAKPKYFGALKEDPTGEKFIEGDYYLYLKPAESKIINGETVTKSAKSEIRVRVGSKFELLDKKKVNNYDSILQVCCKDVFDNADKYPYTDGDYAFFNKVVAKNINTQRIVMSNPGLIRTDAYYDNGDKAKDQAGYFFDSKGRFLIQELEAENATLSGKFTSDSLSTQDGLPYISRESVTVKGTTYVASGFKDYFESEDVYEMTGEAPFIDKIACTLATLSGKFFLARDCGDAEIHFYDVTSGDWTRYKSIFGGGRVNAMISLGSDVIMVGDNGRILIYDSSEDHIMGKIGFTNSLFALAKLSIFQVVAVGESGHVVYYDRLGGGNWTQEDLGSDSLRAVEKLDSGDAVAVGDNGWIAVYDSTSKSWTTMKLNTDHLTAMTTLDDKAIAVGDSGWVAVYDSTSDSWTTEKLCEYDFTHVVALGDKAIAVNYEDSAYIYDSVSDTWTEGDWYLGFVCLAIATVGDKAIILEGFDERSHGHQLTVYDSTNDTWTDLDIDARWDLRTITTLGDKAIIVGGDGWDKTDGSVVIYDSIDDSLTYHHSGTGGLLAAATLGEKVIAVGQNEDMFIMSSLPLKNTLDSSIEYLSTILTKDLSLKIGGESTTLAELGVAREPLLAESECRGKFTYDDIEYDIISLKCSSFELTIKYKDADDIKYTKVVKVGEALDTRILISDLQIVDKASENRVTNIIPTTPSSFTLGLEGLEFKESHITNMHCSDLTATDTITANKVYGAVFN